MHNLAILGLEDFANDKFLLYSSSLFDFGEVRKEMLYIQGKRSLRGRIHVKKFIEGIISHISPMA